MMSNENPPTMDVQLGVFCLLSVFSSATIEKFAFVILSPSFL